MNQDQRDLINICLEQIEGNVKTIRRVVKEVSNEN